MKKTIKMVVLNATFGIALRILNLYPIIVDIISLIKLFRSAKSTGQSISYDNLQETCLVVESCRSIQRGADLLYLISLSTYFFFFNRFDQKFNAAFKRVFFRKMNQNTH